MRVLAKIRAIRPEFFTDEDLVECSPLARLLFAGLWCHACDNGHLKDKPKQIKLRVLPADECDVDALLHELVAAGCITRADGWVIIPHLAAHQRIDKRYFLTCEYPGCKNGKPPLTTRRVPPPLPDELPPDPQVATPDKPSEHTVITPGPHREHAVATESPSTDGDGDGDGDGDKNPSSRLRSDVAEILDHLDWCIDRNGLKKPSRNKSNTDAARLLIDLDGHSLAEIHDVITWATADEFWRSNIRSARKLRDKYDTLRLRMQSRRNPTPDRNAQIIERAFANYDQPNQRLELEP